jgi:hypothetical protein
MGGLSDSLEATTLTDEVQREDQSDEEGAQRHSHKSVTETLLVR